MSFSKSEVYAHASLNRCVFSVVLFVLLFVWLPRSVFLFKIFMFGFVEERGLWRWRLAARSLLARTCAGVTARSPQPPISISKARSKAKRSAVNSTRSHSYSLSSHSRPLDGSQPLLGFSLDGLDAIAHRAIARRRSPRAARPQAEAGRSEKANAFKLALALVLQNRFENNSLIA